MDHVRHYAIPPVRNRGGVSAVDLGPGMITRLNVDRYKFQNDTFGGFIDQNFNVFGTDAIFGAAIADSKWRDVQVECSNEEGDEFGV